MSEENNLQLHDQMCFALYAASAAVTRAYRPLLERIGLTYPQYLVMLVLWQADDVSVGRVARALSLPPHGLGPGAAADGVRGVDRAPQRPGGCAGGAGRAHRAGSRAGASGKLGPGRCVVPDRAHVARARSSA